LSDLEEIDELWKEKLILKGWLLHIIIYLKKKKKRLDWKLI
jgi:hypothetical protein